MNTEYYKHIEEYQKLYNFLNKQTPQNIDVKDFKKELKENFKLDLVSHSNKHLKNTFYHINFIDSEKASCYIKIKIQKDSFKYEVTKRFDSKNNSLIIKASECNLVLKNLKTPDESGAFDYNIIIDNKGYIDSTKITRKKQSSFFTNDALKIELDYINKRHPDSELFKQQKDHLQKFFMLDMEETYSFFKNKKNNLNDLYNLYKLKHDDSHILSQIIERNSNLSLIERVKNKIK